MKKVSLILFATMLTGCATHLSQDQCLNTNWFSVGQGDGNSGHAPRDLGPAIEDCTKFKIAVDTKGYLAGWRQGMKPFCAPTANQGYADGVAGTALNDILQRAPLCSKAGWKLKTDQYHAGWHNGIAQYCTFENGLNFARQGQALPAVCPPTLQKRFEAGWQKGQDQFCNQPANAYALGRDGKEYPRICASNLFVAFRSEYDRGLTTKHTIDDLNSRISTFSSDIDSNVSRYSFKQNAFGYYDMDETSIHNDESNSALTRVNQMVQEKKTLEAQVTNLQLMH